MAAGSGKPAATLRAASFGLTGAGEVSRGEAPGSDISAVACEFDAPACAPPDRRGD